LDFLPFCFRSSKVLAVGEDLRVRVDLVGENNGLPHFRTYEGVDLRNPQKIFASRCPCLSMPIAKLKIDAGNLHLLRWDRARRLRRLRRDDRRSVFRLRKVVVHCTCIVLLGSEKHETTYLIHLEWRSETWE